MAIAGIATSAAGRPADAVTLARMLSLQAFRGPAEQTSRSAGRACLGAVSPCGTASVWADGRLILAIDGELLNLEELAEQAEAPAGQRAPGAVLGRLYERFGQELVRRLRGDFALALWETRSETLLLATDRFGVKPLCYHATAAEIVFASSPRGVLASERMERRVNRSALASFFNFSMIPAPLCVFEGLQKLPPATLLVWRGGTAALERYWDMVYPEDASGSPKQLARELFAHAQEAVELTSRGISNERLGCFLSGGTDSSSVVGLLTRLRHQPVTSISIGFAEEKYNELDYARLAARHFQSRHVVSQVGPEDALPVISRLVEAYDEPYANASVIPTYLCERLAREHGIEVLLAGDGGDELFGGNERYRVFQLYEMYQRVPGLLRRGLIEPLLFAAPKSLGPAQKLQNYVRLAQAPALDRYLRWRLLQQFPAHEVLAPAMTSGNGKLDFLDAARAHFDTAPAHSKLNRLLYLDVKMILGDDDLPKVVRAGELAGVRIRFPYLDHPLAEFSGRIPAKLKVKGLQKRYLFKLAMRDLLPRGILKKKKHGFGLPIGVWVKTNPRFRGRTEEILLDPRTYQRGYFRREFIERLLAEMDRDDSSLFGVFLWDLQMLELWHREHVERSAS